MNSEWICDGVLVLTLQVASQIALLTGHWERMHAFAWALPLKERRITVESVSVENADGSRVELRQAAALR